MTVDAALAEVVTAAVAPLVGEIRELRATVEKLAPPAFVSVAQAAEMLGCSPQTVTAMAKRSELQYRRAGRRLLISVESIRPTDAATVSRLAAEARP